MVRNLLYLAGASLLAWMACAGNLPPVIAPGGVLRVVNQSGEPLEVFVRGDRVLARLEPEQEARVDRLLSGDAPAEARGIRTGWRFVTMLSLDPHREVRWVVRSERDQEAALRALPEGANRVVNGAPEPVRIFLGGQPREILWPGSEGRWTGLVPGTVDLKAEGTQTGFVNQVVVTVGPGMLPTWTVTMPKAAVRVVNRSGVPVRVLTPEAPPRMLDRDQETVFSNLEGDSLPIVVVDAVGRPVWSGAEPLRPGEVSEVRVPTPDASVSVLSEIPEPLMIGMDGQTLGMCPPEGAAEFRGLPFGQVHLSAVAPDGRIIARTRTVLREGAPILWLVRPGAGDETQGDQGSLLLENPSGEEQRIQVEGVDRGRMSPKGRRVLLGIPAGKHRVAVAGMTSGQVFEAEVEVPAGGEGRWTVPVAQALLAMRNARDEEIRVLLDEKPLVRLAPGERVEMSIAAGIHTIQSVGVVSLRGTEHRLSVPPGTRTPLEFPAPYGTLIVTNLLSDPQEIHDGPRSLGVLLPGDRVTLRNLDPGEHLLEARSTRQPLSRHLRVYLAPGETLSWELGSRN